MPDQKTPLEQALDLFVYAPLGIAMAAREALPKLVEAGRNQVTGQTSMAKMIGQFAVSQGKVEADKRLKAVTERIQPSRPAPAPKAAAPVPAASAPATSVAAPAGSAIAAASTSAATANGSGPAFSDDSLAIPGYDSLSASQVVQRLAGLSGAELEAVRSYEAGSRGRKTVLSRIAQLQSGG